MEALSGQTQEMSSESVGNMLVVGPKGGANPAERKARPAPEHALKCPRCDSANTKFCYYNNYSLTQPRYFCKACRRYWTKGGTLRNVPVGGGCRKNRRPSSAVKRPSQDLHSGPGSLAHHHSLAGFPLPAGQMLNAGACYDQNDLALAFARLQKSPDQLGFGHDALNTGFLDALRSGFQSSAAADHQSSLYYGFDVSESSTPTTEMSVPYEQDQMSNGTTTAVTMTTIKQELNGNGNGNERDHHDQDHQSNRMLWGYPWQMNGGHDQHQGIIGNGNVMMSEFDGSANGRESWNGLTSSWHGLLNTAPLM